MILKENRGFTLIELLIVIALIGVLAVALLSTINPVEQTRKAKDSSRKASAAELLNAVERYQATFFCYPWAYSNGTCGNTQKSNSSLVSNDADLLDELENKAEIKPEFRDRDVLKDLYITEDNSSLVHVCFKPESKTFMDQANKPKGGVGNTGNYICVPE